MTKRLTENFIGIGLSLLLLWSLAGLADAAAVFAAASGQLVVSSVNGAAGDEVAVAVSIANNPGIATFNVKLNYDKSQLEPLSLAQGGAITAGGITSNLQIPGLDAAQLDYVTALWYNPSNISANGVLFTVKFRIKPGASGTIPLTLTYNADDVSDQNYDNVSMTAQAGAVEVDVAAFGGDTDTGTRIDTDVSAGTDTGSAGTDSIGDLDFGGGTGSVPLTDVPETDVPTADASGIGPDQPAISQSRTVSKADLNYIYGQNRVLTAIEISKNWPSAHTVILAPGAEANLIDALTVAPLAYQENAPILLSIDDTVDAAVAAEISRLGAAKVILVGALSENVAAQLRTLLPGLTVETLRGQDRFATADLINARVTTQNGTFIVGYNALADAVSAASYAAANGYIIQIAQPDGSFSGTTALGGYILGGPTLVADISGFTRLFGSDRYATNKVIRDTLHFEYTYIFTADGGTLVDALTGSVLAAQSRAAIVLTPGNDPTGVDFGNITDATIVKAFGGAK
ncbi:MAG: cell wall-binding repeat-containing protein [Peptococcaceae bacterium]|jgi:hypothetical protein|nr:cell wall-binding repeat-containing protein [Peptococcaceae bacterium]